MNGPFDTFPELMSIVCYSIEFYSNSHLLLQIRNGNKLIHYPSVLQMLDIKCDAILEQKK